MSEVKDPPASTLDPKLKSLLDLPAQSEKDYIYCAACSHVITYASEKTEVNGAHSHYCVNPHGFEFNVGCFANALGCDISGHPEAADSWFMGYVWRLASCGQCRVHLGWYFSAAAGEHYFYGLILDKIQSETE